MEDNLCGINIRHKYCPLIILLLLIIFLSACDIIKTDSSYNNTTTAQMTGKVSLSGTIAKGSPIPNAPVKIKDKDGKTKEATSGSDGKYEADVTDMSAPFLLKVPEGDKNLYSVATRTGTANVHPFTDLVVRNWYEVKGTDIDTAFDSTGAIPTPPTTTEIDTIEAVVKNTLATFLTQMGLDTTNFNMFTSQFNADSTGFDKLLDNTNITINNTTGQVTVNATDPKTGIGGTIISTTITADIAARDTTKPTDPASLLAIAGGTDGIALIWNASSDNIGISGYNIYRNSAKTGVSPFTVYSDTGLTANTKYCYQVEAYDGAGNISGKSREACATTLSSADTTAPQPPTGLTATAVSSNRIDIAWLASTDDDVAGYHIYRDTVKTVGVTATTYSDTGLSANTKYCYTIKAIDGSGNISSQSSSEVCAITSAETGDTTAPSNVSISINSGASETTSASIILTLSAADDTGIIEYYLSESSTIPPENATGWVSITSTKSYSAAVSFTLSGVSQTGSYTKTIYVWFRDTAGNISAVASDSITLIVTDLTAPSNPSVSINNGDTSTTSTAVTLSLSATDDVGVTGHYVSESSAAPSANASGWVSVTSTTSYSATISFTLSSESQTGSYAKTVYVWFRDTAGNISASANDNITLTVSDTTAPSSPSISINNGDTSTTSTSVTLTLSATDDAGVTGYYVSESSSTPLANATGWISVTSTTTYSATANFTLTSGSVGDNTKSVYIWFRDTAGNVSASASDSITLTVSDITAPSIPSISINNGDTSTTSTSVTLTLSATDDAGVTGYYVSESSSTPSANATGWVSVTSTTTYSATANFTLTSGSVGDNTKIVYVWFRDSAGNVSAPANDSITLTVSDTTAPSNPSISINNGDASTITISVTLTLSATDNVGVTGYCAKESSVTPLNSDTCWASVTSTTSYSASSSFTLSSSSGTKTVYVWFRDAAGNISSSATNSITLTVSGTTITDINGNVYNTVTIGTQVWMKENLKATKYRNGDAIPTTTASMSNETSPKYQWAYNGNESNVATYGRLYTWYAVTDSRGICPTDWHVPTDTEWTTLTDYLGGESVAGGKMKEVGTTHWNSPNTNADNSSGFTALPGGYRNDWGTFYNMGFRGYWWSATEYDTTRAWNRFLFYDDTDAYRDFSGFDKSYGFSVRCVKDTAPSAPTGVSASAGNGQVTISWSSVSGATSYNIYWSTSSGVTKTTGTKITGATSSYTHTGLTNGTTYYYVVTGVGTYGESAESSQVSATPSAPTPTTLASGLSNPKSIALDSTSVYWTEYGSGTVKKVSINGGTVTTLASGLVDPQEVSLTVDSANVYYGDGNIGNGTLNKVSTSGGTVTTLASGLNYPQGVQVDSTDAYWVDAYGTAGKIKKVALSGGNVTTLVSSGLNYASAKIAIDSSNVYWAEYQGNTIKKVSKSGGTVTTLASGLNIPYTGVAADSTNVYWTEYNSSGTVKKVSINGGTVTTLASGLNYPYSIAVDSTNVYWTEYNSSGTVKKVSINGGTVTTLASGLSNPYGIAVDSTSVYWTEYGGGTVKKIAK